MNAPAITQQYDAKIKFAAVEREIKFRRRVYPRWIEAGKITDGFAATQISIFEAIAEDYRQEAEKERLL
jgi:hypothetical protein